MKNTFLTHIIVTPVVLGLLAYSVQIYFEIQNIAYGMLFVLALSVVCFIGQRMIKEVKIVIF